MADRGRSACYRAEWELGEQPQLPWEDLLALAGRVVNDPVVKAAYPRLTARKLLLKPVHRFLQKKIGHYEPRTHRIQLWWGGRDELTLVHELAHAAAGQGHDMAWRDAFLFLGVRFLEQETALRLVAAFNNNGVYPREGL